MVGTKKTNAPRVLIATKGNIKMTTRATTDIIVTSQHDGSIGLEGVTPEGFSLIAKLEYAMVGSMHGHLLLIKGDAATATAFDTIDAKNLLTLTLG